MITVSIKSIDNFEPVLIMNLFDSKSFAEYSQFIEGFAKGYAEAKKINVKNLKIELQFEGD